MSRRDCRDGGEVRGPGRSPIAVASVPRTAMPAGDVLAAPRCTEAELGAERCPHDTVVGVVGTYKAQGVTSESAQLPYLYNLTPDAGYPAEFGFVYLEQIVILRARALPSTQGYVLSVGGAAIPGAEFSIREATVTFFGDPSVVDGGPLGQVFATTPVDCASGPAVATLETNSWQDPSDWQQVTAPMFTADASHAVTGCSELQFDPQVQVTPETTTADTPSGYEIEATVPQTPNIEGDLATSDLKNAVLTFPSGVSISPSAANGLQACPATGPEGIDLGNHDQLDADKLASEGVIQEGEERGYHGNEDGLVHPAAGHCPSASQVGTVEVETPLLEQPLKGHLYVAEPECGDAGQPQCTPQDAEDGKLFGLYLEIAGSGIVVKLRGQVSVNTTTGQITTTFREAPELPFSSLKVKLDGKERAPLANPQSCGTFTTTTDLTPWSTPWTPDATPSSSFNVSGCSGAFSPGFTAGMTQTLHAGAYSPFTLTFSRHDGEQDLSGLTVSMPEGLVGRIAGIAQCGEAEVKAAEANNGGCPAASKVGAATAAAGAGSDPFWQTGSVYLTGPYDGAPFGLAVVVPANAGPFHLGNIVVRAAIHINPETAAVTVVSDPLPQMIDGVPLRVKTVNVTVGQGTNFTFNPTSCEPTHIAATITSAQGAAANVSSPYQASGCATLPFKPSFTVSTQGATSRHNGASLDVRIATHQGPDQGAGEEANIRKVDTQLPVALPSRLTTLQKACTEKQFASNPAGCPEGSFVGSAVAHTPLLPVPLEGPAILVSHGGAAFPDLDLVLQGDGVLIDLVGNTNIEHGVTYSKFETAPDAPFSSFELKLPEGPHSILGSYVATGGYSFCNYKKLVTTTKTVTKKVKGRNRRVKVKVKTKVAASLEMPTTLAAQNGAVVKQTTKIAVVGCPSAAAAKKAAVRKAAAAKARQAGRRP